MLKVLLAKGLEGSEEYSRESQCHLQEYLNKQNVCKYRNVNGASVGGSEGNDQFTGYWREGDPCYIVAEIKQNCALHNYVLTSYVKSKIYK